MAEEKDNHITARIDPQLKKAGLDYAAMADRHKTWVWAKAIEFGLPEVMRRFPPPTQKAKKAA